MWGRSSELRAQEMQSLTNFILQVSYPPNPIHNLDNSLTPEQQVGHDFFFGQISDSAILDLLTVSQELCSDVRWKASSSHSPPIWRR
jgi:hypothetical protein